MNLLLHGLEYPQIDPVEQFAEDILKKEQRIAEIMAEIKAVLGRGDPA